MAQRRYEKLHEKRPWHDGLFRVWAEEYSPLTPFHFMDGVSIWVSREDLSPDDNFLGDRRSAGEDVLEHEDGPAGGHQ